ncbi:MAG: protein kinase [Planctomycetes bacterium]|nr:protein kinase [Planctomycetota bacterium]
MNDQSTITNDLKLDTGFLELESMASMQRVGADGDGTAFNEGGSTLLDLDGLSEKLARKAAEEHRQEMAHGHHVSERYKVLGEIARGGMGAVLEVQDSDLDRNVAMKVLLRDTRRAETDSGSPMDTGPVNRFIAEAQLTGSLEHPNIVPVHELGLDAQGRVYFTMKRVKGRSLRHIMDKLRQGHAATLAEFGPGRLLSILLKICDAIEFAHSRGIVHRDLKPENIMVGQFGEVLVMDWGLAKQIRPGKKTDAIPKQDTPQYELAVSLGSTDGDTGGTREGTISGTPAYMSPEQARGLVAEITQRTDIFCLGGILYEMLCLVPPFLAATITEALDNAREHRLLAPREKLEAVLRNDQLRRAFGEQGIARGRKHPRELVSIAMRAMKERRELRYNSVADFKRDIEGYLSASPISAHRDSPWTSLSKWARRNPTRAAVMTLAIVFVLLGGAVAAVARAKFAEDRARLAEETAEAEAGARNEAQRRLRAEAEARDQAVKARIEAERVATLEAEKRERDAKEAEALNARKAAFGPYSQASDLRARSATFQDWGIRAETWRLSVGLYQRAIRLDPSFVEAHLELAGILADLGFDDEALYHYARGDALTAAQTGRGHVEALMAFAMYDFQRKVLREGLSANFDEVFRRFAPVRDAAEPGSNYARIAQVLLDLGESYRTATLQEFIKASREASEKLAAIEGEGVPLWEVYTLLAIVDEDAGASPRVMGRSYLQRARELKPNLPLLTWLEVREIGRRESGRERAGIALWDRFTSQFPYDPRGYFSRATLRFSSESERNAAAEIADLEAAVRLNPGYADAHKLMLRIHVREGQTVAAMRHLDAMRKSQSGLDNHAIDLIEVELTASTGEYTRMTALVLAALHESTPHGVRTFVNAAGVLLRDHEYRQLELLCDTIAAQSGPATPPVVLLFKGRALTMLARFEDALALLRALEESPLLISEDYRPTLRDWADDARRYPVLLAGNSFPPARHRFDLGRILAVAGAEPERFISLLDTDKMRRQEILDYASPADQVLRAIGYARQARDLPPNRSMGKRTLAVLCLKQAFDDGYLNRPRVLGDEFLAPLITDPQLAKYFDVR